MRASIPIAVLSTALCALLACESAREPSSEDGTSFAAGAGASGGSTGGSSGAVGGGGGTGGGAGAGHADGGADRDAGAGGDGAQDAATSDAGASSELPASCRNGLRDGAETDIDCGGSECGTCLSGRRCERGEDCLSGECEDSACTCLPLRACPDDACGVVRHCGGELDCGECASGVCYENACCEPRECEDGECGVFSDGCGGTIRCGDDSCCTPRTCEHASLENRCGEFDDRCGGTVTCACAEAAAVCYLAECCMPATCEQADACGVAVSDGCGGVRSCTCAEGSVCYQGQCCEPADCGDFAGPGCAQMPDGCGGTVSCGCDDGDVCNEGECCTPACPAGGPGDACGLVDNGCGGTTDCGCSGGLPCIGGVCCGALTCAEQGRDHRCGPAGDGCGGSGLWCGCGTSNGIRVAQRSACGDACADTLGEVRTCTAAAAREVLDQTGGWNFSLSLSSSLCSASYGFVPAWTDCHNGFQIDAQGFVYLGAGTHCFSITGSGGNSCGALYFVAAPDGFAGWDALPDATAAVTVTGGAPVCFTLAVADYHPIRWHYTQDAALEDFHVNYCAGDASNCSPLPSSMLWPALP